MPVPNRKPSIRERHLAWFATPREVPRENRFSICIWISVRIDVMNRYQTPAVSSSGMIL